MATEQEKELVRERVSLVDLVSTYTSLKKNGNRYSGLCPFPSHNDKDPSFTVDDERKLFHCFGCGQGGDMFTFVMLMENVDFGTALEMLAKRANVTLTKKGGPQSSQRKKQKERVARINELATRYFFKVLTGTEHGAKFLDYLYERGVTKEQIREYKLGAAMDSWDGLIKALRRKGFSAAELATAGLAIHKSERNSHYDRFRNRLMFPLFNIFGEVIGFAGRAWGDDMPKYLNTPETPLFIKSKLLYGLHIARKNIEDNVIYLTEGYMDVIALHGAGIKNSVASMGTALTEDQVNMLSKYCGSVVLAYDSDFAGDRASMRGIEMLVEKGMGVSVVSLPEGEDPDSIVKAGGRAAFDEYVAKSADYFDFFIEKSIESGGADTPDQKWNVIKMMAPLLEKTPNASLRDHQRKRISERLDVREEHVETALEQAKKKSFAPRNTNSEDSGENAVKKAMTGAQNLEKNILEDMLTTSENADRILRELEPSDFSAGPARAFFQYCLDYAARNEGFDPDEFLNATHPQEIVMTLSRLSLVSKEEQELVGTMIDTKLARFRQEQAKREIRTLRTELQQAEQAGDAQKARGLMSRIGELMKVRHAR